MVTKGFVSATNLGIKGIQSVYKLDLLIKFKPEIFLQVNFGNSVSLLSLIRRK